MRESTVTPAPDEKGDHKFDNNKTQTRENQRKQVHTRITIRHRIINKKTVEFEGI